MEIIYKDFKLKPGTTKWGYDLYRIVPVIVTKANQKEYPGLKIGDKTKDKRDSWLAYDMQLHHAIPKMINEMLADDISTVSLSDFLVAYVKEKEEVTNHIKEYTGWLQ